MGWIIHHHIKCKNVGRKNVKKKKKKNLQKNLQINFFFFEDHFFRVFVLLDIVCFLLLLAH